MSPNYRLLLALLLLSILSLITPRTDPLAAAAPAASQEPGLAAPSDPLHARVRAELRVFTNWLAVHGADGYIGEVGWPNDAAGDGTAWNALAEAWYQDADAAGLWVTAWDAGQRRCEYKLAIYKTAECGQPPLVRADTQASVVEAHPTTSRYKRGINVAGAAAGAPWQGDPTSSFSNANPGRYALDYVYDDQSTFDYLAARGISLVRLAFRWERIQPHLGQALDAGEFERLRAAVQRAERAGLEVVLNVHNYGAYYLDDGGRGVRRTIGSAEVTREHFGDLWARLSTAFVDNPAVVAYGLMNEPSGMTPAEWQAQAQAALEAIRATGDTRIILVPGHAWATGAGWSRHHPRPWIVDPAAKVRYEMHHYFDRASWGTYDYPYHAELVDAQLRGFGQLLAVR